MKEPIFRRLVVIWPQLRTLWYYWLENSLIIAIVVSWWQRNQRNHFCIYGLRCRKSQSQRLHPAYLIIDWEINCIDREYRINARWDNWQCDHGVEPMINTALSGQARRRVVWWIGSWNHRKPNRPDSDNASWSYDLVDKTSIISKTEQNAFQYFVWTTEHILCLIIIFWLVHFSVLQSIRKLGKFLFLKKSVAKRNLTINNVLASSDHFHQRTHP